MRRIERSNAFKRDYRREQRRNPRGFERALREIVEALVDDRALPVRNRDHALSGPWSGYRDCHVRSDTVLIYRKREDVLELVRLGSHSELFE